jgi:hypothetical protein
VFELFDIYGKLILSTSENSSTEKNINQELNIAHLENGSYILYIRQNNFKTAYKIMKQ